MLSKVTRSFLLSCIILISLACLFFWFYWPEVSSFLTPFVTFTLSFLKPFFSFYLVLVYMLLISGLTILLAVFVSLHLLLILVAFFGFLLAFVLGDLALISYLINNRLKAFYNPMYRVLRLAVLFLAGAIVLEGIGWGDMLDWWLSKGGLNEQEIMNRLIDFIWSRIPLKNWGLLILFLAYASLFFAKLRGWIKELGLTLGSVLLFGFVGYGLIFLF